MKKQIFFLFALLALGFSGCSNEENIETGNSEEIRVAVTFDIGTSSRAANESYLSEVTLYTFKEDGQFVDAQNTTMNNGSITFPGTGKYIIEAIANENGTLQGLKNYDDFKTRTTVYANAIPGRLQMRGVQTAKVTNVNPSPAIHFAMRRLVSRISIENNVKDFVLTYAHLTGAMKQSYFYKDDVENMDYWNLTETEDKTVTTFTPSTTGGKTTYNSVFYVYECPNDKCSLTLDMKGTIDGIEHIVPTLDEEAFIGNHKPLRRNVQYTVKLNEVDGAIVANLEVSDWEEGDETEGAIVSPNGNTIEVTVTPAAAAGENYAIADEAEREVKDLAVYLFDAEGKLEKAHTGLLSTAWTPANMGDSQKITLNNILNKENKTLYIVANAAANNTVSLNNLQEKSTTTADFEALMATAATENLSCPLLMFKKVEIAAEGWNGEVAQVSAALERVAARIDLRVSVNSGFTPETIKLVGANDQSFVIASAAATATAPLTLQATVAATAEGDYLNYTRLFYTYSIGSTEGMYLLLEGTQKSGSSTAQAIYKKPLSEMEGFDKIEHNTCYTITIDNVNNVPLVTGGEISGEVIDND